MEADRLEEQAQVDMYGEQLNDYITALVPWGRTRFDQSQSFNVSRPGRNVRSITLAFITLQQTRQFNALVPPIVEELGRMFSQQLTKNRSGYLVGPKV